MNNKLLGVAFSATTLVSIGFNLPAFAQSAIDEIPLDETRQSVASLWVSEILNAVSTPGAGSFLGPTGASRAYGMLGTAMYDAWAIYEDTPVSALYFDGLIDSDLQRPQIENTLSNKQEAISHAAFGILNSIFADTTLQDGFRQQMIELGFDPDNTSTTGTSAAEIGNFVAQEWLDFRLQDGSNQLNNYADTTGYVPTNTVSNKVNIEAWTPESVPIGSEGTPEFIRTQTALTPQWADVSPFALTSGSQFLPPPPEPFLLDPEATVDLVAQTITRSDNTTVPISQDLIGTDINPGFIDQAQRVVDLSASLSDPTTQPEGDTRKLVAEFWEDGGGTPFPPGTWMLFAQKVAEKEDPDLDFDVPLFLNLGNAVFDAGIATWDAKYTYDYVRPVRGIRDLGELGLLGEDPDGDGVYTILAWGGPELGTIEIPVTEFLTYQTPGGDPSPPFPEYTSGHSAFSAASAEVLRSYTGSNNFILGDGTQGLSVTFQPGESRFEPGFTPMTEITLGWQTFTEAADEAGISRLYGGIHFDDGDLNGRALGRQVGETVFNRTELLLNGGQQVPEPTSVLSLLIFGGLMGLRRKKS